MDFESSFTNREELAEKLKKALAISISKSKDVQKIITRIEEMGYQLNVWMMIGIFLQAKGQFPITLEDSSENLTITDSDLDWLKSINIDIKNLDSLSGKE